MDGYDDHGNDDDNDSSSNIYFDKHTDKEGNL